MMPFGLVIFVAVCAVGLCLFWLVARREHVSRTEAFAELYAVRLTERSHALLDAALTRSRSLRILCAIATTIVFTIVERDPGLYSVLGAVAVGFAIGSLVDEATRPEPDGRRTARVSLDRRSVTTFVERWVLVLLAVEIIAALTAGAILLRLIDSVSGPQSEELPARWTVIASLVAVVAVGGLGALLLRRLALMPVPAGADDVLAVLHAMRMAAVLSVVGAVLVIVGFVGVRMGNTAMLNDSARRESLRWMSNISTLICGFGIVAGLPLSLRALPRSRSRRPVGNPSTSSVGS